MASIYYPGYAQKLVSQGYGGYAGWGDDEAFADFQATGGQGKQTQAASSSSDTGSNNTSNTSNDPAQNLIDIAAQNRIKAAQAFKDYNAANPFSFDEYLKGEATRMAEEQQGIGTEGTFYNEQLSDYLLGVGRKIERTGADTRDLIGELQASSKSFGEDTQLKLTEALNKSREGFAESGLFDSGGRYRQEGLLERGAGDTLAQEQRRTGYDINRAQKGLTRTQEDYGLGQFSPDNPSAFVPGLVSRGEIRGMYRGAGQDVSNLASQLAKEKGQQYVRGFQQTQPAELQANTDFDLLKQIGVYS